MTREFYAHTEGVDPDEAVIPMTANGWSLVPTTKEVDGFDSKGEYGFHVRAIVDEDGLILDEGDRIVMFFTETQLRDMLDDVEARKVQWGEDEDEDEDDQLVLDTELAWSLLEAGLRTIFADTADRTADKVLAQLREFTEVSA